MSSAGSAPPQQFHIARKPWRARGRACRMLAQLNLGRIVSDQELVQLAERRARAPPSVKAPPVQAAPVPAAAHKRWPTTKRPQRAAHKQQPTTKPQKLPAVRPEHWADDTSALLFANPAASSTSSWPGPEQLAAERPAHARAATPPAAWVARHKECLRRQTSHWSRSGERAATPLIPPRLTSSSHAAIRGGGAAGGGAAALMSGASAPHLERHRSPPRTAAADARRPLLRSDSSSDPRRVSPPHTVVIDASSSGWPDSPPRSQTAAADARRPRVSSGSPPSSSTLRAHLSSGRPASPPHAAPHAAPHAGATDAGAPDTRRAQLSSGRPDSPPWRPPLSKDRPVSPPASPPRSQTAAADARRPRFITEAAALAPGQQAAQAAEGLQGCRAAGLQGCRAAGLQGCRAAGLQGCRAAGLQGCTGCTRCTGCRGPAPRRCGGGA